MKTSIGAIILAGGKSQRMGCPKPYLDFRGRTFLEKIIETYKLADVQNITVVLNKNYVVPIWKKLLSHIQTEAKLVINDNSVSGRFHSLKIGLENMPEVDYCFLQNVDNPFVNSDLLNKLIENRKEDAYSLPIFENKGGHPTLISASLIHDIRKIEKTELTLREILSKYPRNEVMVKDPSVLFNINTPDEYKHHQLNHGTFQ